MPELQETLDVLSFVFTLITISAIITLVWISTYVRDQSVIATAVVVFQEDTLPTSPIPSPTREARSPMDSSTQTVDCDPSNSVAADNIEAEVKSSSTKSEEKEESYEEGLEQPEPTLNNIEQLQEDKAEDSEIEKVDDLCSEKETNIPLEKTDASSSSGLRQRKHKLENVSKEPLSGTESVEGTNHNIEESSSEAYIRIKLKFLDDTQRLVRGQLTDEVGSFKRANFNPELASNCKVRLIFNGQLLNRDSSTLGQYGLFDNCVVHCHISQPQPSSSSDQNESLINRDNDDLDLSDYLNPLLLLIVVILWYLRYEYSYIFNTSATVILACLTALLLISQYALVLSFNISFGLDGGNGNNRNNGNSVNNAAFRASSGSTVEHVEHVAQPRSVPSSSSNNESASAVSEDEPTNSHSLGNKHTKNDSLLCRDTVETAETTAASVENIEKFVSAENKNSFVGGACDSSSIMLNS